MGIRVQAVQILVCPSAAWETDGHLEASPRLELLPAEKMYK